MTPLLSNARVPVLGFAAWSGTGKTTLLTRLIPVLRERGLRIGLVKHAHHSFEIDKRGKDSFELRTAGATQVMLASRKRWALMMETPGRDEPDLNDLLRHMDQEALDLILVEGFKHERFPKIEIHRPSLARPLFFPEDDTVLAITSDGPIDPNPRLPLLDMNQPESIADFILDWLQWRPERSSGHGA